jgi:hypothetical protein
MIGKNGLLSILQFVAVIIPAFVVLIEVVISRDTGERIEIGSFKIDEIRLLEYSLVFLILGTGLILYRLLSFIENPFTAYGVVFIFGSIPLSVIALWIMNNRREYNGSDSENMSKFIRNNMKNTLHKTVIFFSGIIVPIAAIWLLPDVINNTLSFGIFSGSSILSPQQFVSIGFVICAVKNVSTVNSTYENTEVGNPSFGGSLGSGIVLVLIYSIFTGIPYLIVILVLRFTGIYSFIEPANVFLNIPFIWTILVYYALLEFDYSPNITSKSEIPDSE